MILIQAMNIHNGGGATLLSALLCAPCDVPRRVWVDQRYTLPANMAGGIDIHRVRATLKGRFAADRAISRLATPQDTYFGLGNLPPIHRPDCRVIVSMQNRYLIDDVSLATLPRRDRLRLQVERVWLRALRRNVDVFLIPTPVIARLMEPLLAGTAVQMQVLSFLATNPHWQRRLRPLAAAMARPISDAHPFLYVASGEAHKNHENLVQAWIILAQQGIFPPLQLTLDQKRFGGLSARIMAQAAAFGLKITTDASAPSRDVRPLFAAAGAVINPSKLESFNLTLVEARQAGLPILAPELDYVRDILDPEEVFDPNSPPSIARAVKRFMGIAEADLPVVDAENLLRQVQTW